MNLAEQLHYVVDVPAIEREFELPADVRPLLHRLKEQRDREVLDPVLRGGAEIESGGRLPEFLQRIRQINWAIEALLSIWLPPDAIRREGWEVIREGFRQVRTRNDIVSAVGDLAFVEKQTKLADEAWKNLNRTMGSYVNVRLLQSTIESLTGLNLAVGLMLRILESPMGTWERDAIGWVFHDLMARSANEVRLSCAQLVNDSGPLKLGTLSRLRSSLPQGYYGPTPEEYVRGERESWE